MSHKKDARLIWVKLPHGFKTIVLSIFEWRLKTGFTVIAVDPDELAHLGLSLYPSVHYLSEMDILSNFLRQYKLLARFSGMKASST